MSSDFIWYELLTPDTAAAETFYKSVIGWEAKDSGVADVSYTLFSVSGYDTYAAGMMALNEDMLARKVPPNWSGYVYAEEVDAKAAEFVAEGGSINVPPMDIPSVGRFAVVADPQGAVICLMNPIPPEGGMPEAPPAGSPGTFAWRELYATDAPAAVAFYEKVFGWKESAAMDMGPMGKYHLFGLGEDDMGGIMKKPDEMPMSAWGYYIAVDGLNAAIERVKAGGGQLLNGPMDVPGGAVVAQCLDPQGAFFCLVSNTP
ncbi:VOC family protein [Martelella endophytica]|uniref:Glyoxalase n=1 Tax=Martelella endophytica TaxID=1486262 RepID=A0A0D5LPG7_MAREN|nr:VOC family protein [Martelella endophytica]AJY46016.1 glyoxalase [Martelella endophytica]